MATEGPEPKSLALQSLWSEPRGAGKHSGKALGLIPWDVFNFGHPREICSPVAAGGSAGCRALVRSRSRRRPQPGARSPLPQSSSQHLHRQPTGTPVHATNSWINAYVLMNPFSPAGREGNQEKSKHSEYPLAASPPGAPSHRRQDGHRASTSCPCSPPPVHPDLLSLQKQQHPRADFFRHPPGPQHTPPHLCPTTHTAQRGTAAAIPHAHIYGCNS